MADPIDQAMADLGITLLPWQRDLAERLLGGESVRIMRARQHGRSELRRLLGRLAAASAPYSPSDGDR